MSEANEIGFDTIFADGNIVLNNLPFSRNDLVKVLGNLTAARHMESAGVLVTGTNKTLISLILELAQRSTLLGSGYNESKSYKLIQNTVKSFVKRSVPNSHRDVFVSSLNNARKIIKRGVLASDDDDDAESTEDDEPSSSSSSSCSASDSDGGREDKKRKNKMLLKKKRGGNDNKIHDLDQCSLFDRSSSIQVTEMLRNNKLLQPLSIGSNLEQSLNKILCSGNVPMVKTILDATERAPKEVIWNILKACLTISLKDKKEMFDKKLAVCWKGRDDQQNLEQFLDTKRKLWDQYFRQVNQI